MMYANDFHDQYVRAGGPGSVWGVTKTWDATTEVLAYGTPPPPSNKATIGACLYYLVKYADVSPKTFICGGDTGASEFKLANYNINPPNNLITQDIMLAWDFGPIGTTMNILKHYSYAYQYPFVDVTRQGYFPLNSLSDAGIVIMADRNPYMVLSPDTNWKTYIYRVDNNGAVEAERWGNSPNHKRDGQNILFNDCHVSFEREPYCGFDSDNIYTYYGGTTKKIQEGSIPTATLGGTTGTTRCFNTIFAAGTKTDTILINEGYDQGNVLP
jgi:hypothetical protein